MHLCKTCRTWYRKREVRWCLSKNLYRIGRRSPLVHATSESLVNLDLPNDTKDFLTHAGLPSKALFQWSFDRLQDALSILPSDLAVNLPAPFCNNTYFEIGEFVGGTPYHSVTPTARICLQECTGFLILVFPPHESRDRLAYFVNSSVYQFSAFLLAYEQFFEAWEDDPMEYEKKEDLIEKLLEICGLIDPKAMETVSDETEGEEQNYWPGMINDLYL